MDSDCWFVSDISSRNFCIIENRFVLVPTCQSEQMHYHRKCFFRRAETSMTFLMFGPLQGWILFFPADQSTNPGPFNTETESCPCLYRAKDLRMISGANIQKVKCANMILLHHEGEGNKVKYVGKKWLKWKTCLWREEDQKEMTSLPRHLLNCVPQNIRVKCFNSSHIIRQMAIFTDCPLGSRHVSWQVELPTPDRLGGWLHTVEASKIQIVCRKFVRMSGCPSVV